MAALIWTLVVCQAWFSLGKKPLVKHFRETEPHCLQGASGWERERDFDRSQTAQVCITQRRSNCTGSHLGSLEPKSSPNRSLGVLWGCRFGDASVPWCMPLQCTADPGTHVHQAGQAAAFLLNPLEPLTWGSGCAFLLIFWFVPMQGLANLQDFLLSCRVCTLTLGGGSSSWEIPAALGRFWSHILPLCWAEHSLVNSASPLNTLLEQWTLPFFLSVSLFLPFSALAFTFFLFSPVFPFLLSFGGVFLRESRWE